LQPLRTVLTWAGKETFDVWSDWSGDEEKGQGLWGEYSLEESWDRVGPPVSPDQRAILLDTAAEQNAM
jgi:hypothetical protein